jgi:hypothetical protein
MHGFLKYLTHALLLNICEVKGIDHQEVREVTVLLQEGLVTPLLEALIGHGEVH